MKELCTLKYSEAVDLIKERQKVYYRHGVWNEYELKNVVDVVPRILGSGYGADICEKDGELYVSVPADADMW